MQIKNWTIMGLLTLIGLLAACTGTGTDTQTLNVGSVAPGFTLPNAAGGEVSLASYQGKQPVLLFFHMAAG